jgi:drug/metabolite transporter (DMT)-like permease
MLLSVACFITNVLLIRAFGRPGGDVATITALRFAAGLLLCLALHRRELDTPALFRRPRLVLRGLLGGVSTYGFYLTVLQLGAGRATFLNNLYVVFSALLAVVCLAEPFRRPLVFGAVSALAGLALLTGAFRGPAGIGPYDALAVLVAGSAAWVVVTIRQLHHEGVSTATIFAAQCVYGLLLCAPLLVLHPAWPGLPAALGFTLGGFFAGAGQLAMTRAYRHLAVADGALLQTLVPLGIATGGLVFFGEAFTWVETLGAALIVAGSLWPLLPSARFPRATPRAPHPTPPAEP